MSWRPTDWKNPHPYADKVYEEMRSVLPNSEHYAFEAGADAILEALKKNGKLLEKGLIPMPPCMLYNQERVHIVFIPEEH